MLTRRIARLGLRALMVFGLSGALVFTSQTIHASSHSPTVVSSTQLNGGASPQTDSALKYYCVTGNKYSGGYDMHAAPVASERCFTSRHEADQALGVDPRTQLENLPNSNAGGPPGSSHDDGSRPGHICTAGLPAESALGAGFQMAFTRCAGGVVAIASTTGR